MCYLTGKYSTHMNIDQYNITNSHASHHRDSDRPQKNIRSDIDIDRKDSLLAYSFHP